MRFLRVLLDDTDTFQTALGRVEAEQPLLVSHHLEGASIEVDEESSWEPGEGDGVSAQDEMIVPIIDLVPKR